MTSTDSWKMCAEALERLGGLAKFHSSEAVFEEVQRLYPSEMVTFEKIAEELEKNSLKLQPAPSLPIFISDSRGYYALAREPLDRTRPKKESEEEQLKEQVIEDLEAFAKTIYLSEPEVLDTEYTLDGKRVDVVLSSDGSLWLLELKAIKETGSGVAQVASYVDLAREKVDTSASVFGVVVAPDFTDDAKTIAKSRNVRLVRYRKGLYFEPADP